MASRRAQNQFMGLAILFVVVVAVGGMSYFYRRDMARARERVSHGRIAKTSCGPVEYLEAGAGDAILAIHGAGGGFDQGAEATAPLAGQGFRVVAMSRFGYLGTPLPPNASAEAQADAHAALMDALHIDRAVVIGASAGAPSAMQLAIRHPEKVSALVLLVPAAFVPHEDGSPSLKTPHKPNPLFDLILKSDFLFWAASHFAGKTIARAILATPPEDIAEATTAEQARVIRVRDHLLPISARRLGLRNDARVTSTLEPYPLDRITAPTLAISVADDLYGTLDAARYTAKHVPHGRLHEMARGGHLWVGHNSEVAATIARFARNPLTD